mmetsp:Transcript_10779/g.23431  ORF Transcript_10779/g.23431 Transcript_10779/m.23431 type:complete len:367 (+) Transcript_10779:401-1501(+)
MRLSVIHRKLTACAKWRPNADTPKSPTPVMFRSSRRTSNFTALARPRPRAAAPVSPIWELMKLRVAELRFTACPRLRARASAPWSPADVALNCRSTDWRWAAAVRPRPNPAAPSSPSLVLFIANTTDLRLGACPRPRPRAAAPSSPTLVWKSLILMEYKLTACARAPARVATSSSPILVTREQSRLSSRHIRKLSPCAVWAEIKSSISPCKVKGCLASLSTVLALSETTRMAKKLIAAITRRLLLALSNPPSSCSTTSWIMILSSSNETSAVSKVAVSEARSLNPGNFFCRSCWWCAGPRCPLWATSSGVGSTVSTWPLSRLVDAIASCFLCCAMTTFSKPHHMRLVTTEPGSITSKAPSATWRAR